MLIDGGLTEALSGARYENINPATESVLGTTADAGTGDLDAAIAAARRAFDETTWATDHEFRARCLLQLHDAIASEEDQLRAELVAEVGTPVKVTYMGQLRWPLAEAFRWPAQMISNFEWERCLPDRDIKGVAHHRDVFKEPVGVVGAIIPWNYPFEITANKLGPALATGNTVVLKPAPDTPWNATRIGRLIAECTDIPAGVVNIVTSSDRRIGAALVTDPRVDMISFTGSTQVGRDIMAAGAPTLKRLFLELGGKSAMIVCDDADFAKVLPASGAACIHAGQTCTSLTRLLLPRSRYGAAIEQLADVWRNIPRGDPNDPKVLCGPLVNSVQRDRVDNHVRRAEQQGARIVVGGKPMPGFDRGYFYEPTLIADVTTAMDIARDEVFGPVLVAIPYDDDDDAVRIANDSIYGLAGAVYSESTQRAKSIARRVRAGVLSVNGGMWYGADAPFGGFKSSGVGRQNGVEGLETYTETKVVGWV
ncbi:3-succinoylsemialdehyde-pyridine dehydrogenase [Mycolicibacterium vanbaalenii]|uniref:3-succinoylsemialdehyde-pyridine dehydrogenase n=1 Tax=Mycolicibacterium vanbaalenii TaxID=110539 RepID=A0A5S9RBB8_MYCVN|nr:aldehyde dehydrogenase family protein [Mycolicibacterium vanbaalenii]CAA0137678.1 3-succinoylsemialdehyde-pyridine dehydrogenase [Mycolicibacterium vanbaalenii]